MQIYSYMPKYINQSYNTKTEIEKNISESFKSPNCNSSIMLPNYTAISFLALSKDAKLSRKTISIFRNHCYNTFPDEEEKISSMTNFKFEEYYKGQLVPKIRSAMKQFPKHLTYEQEYINVNNITIILQKKFGIDQEIRSYREIRKELNLTKTQTETLNSQANKLLRKYMGLKPLKTAIFKSPLQVIAEKRGADLNQIFPEQGFDKIISLEQLSIKMENEHTKEILREAIEKTALSDKEKNVVELWFNLREEGMLFGSELLNKSGYKNFSMMEMVKDKGIKHIKSIMNNGGINFKNYYYLYPNKFLQRLKTDLPAFFPNQGFDRFITPRQLFLKMREKHIIGILRLALKKTGLSDKEKKVVELWFGLGKEGMLFGSELLHKSGYNNHSKINAIKNKGIDEIKSVINEEGMAFIEYRYLCLKHKQEHAAKLPKKANTKYIQRLVNDLCQIFPNKGFDKCATPEQILSKIEKENIIEILRSALKQTKLNEREKEVATYWFGLEGERLGGKELLKKTGYKGLTSINQVKNKAITHIISILNEEETISKNYYPIHLKAVKRFFPDIDLDIANEGNDKALKEAINAQRNDINAALANIEKLENGKKVSKIISMLLGLNDENKFYLRADIVDILGITRYEYYTTLDDAVKLFNKEMGIKAKPESANACKYIDNQDGVFKAESL